MSKLAIRLQAEELRALAFGDITPAYTALGDRYQNAVRMYHLQNLTNTILVWSWDGVTDNGVIPAGSFLLLDVTTNKTVPEGQFLPKFGSTYIRSFLGGNPVSGSIYLTVFYGADNN